MRPEKRIDYFLKALGKEWKKQGSDLRFTQFLFNNGIQDLGGVLYHLDEFEILLDRFPQIDPATYMVWGTRGKDGKSKLKWLLIRNMETDHIENILKNVKNISPTYVTVFENELKKRITNKLDCEKKI